MGNELEGGSYPGCIIKMLDRVMLDRAFGDNEDNGIKSVAGSISMYRSSVA